MRRSLPPRWLRPGFSEATSRRPEPFWRVTATFLTSPGKSQYNRRLHRAAPLLRRLFRLLALIHKRSTEEEIYLIDSFPAEACDNIRISQTRLYQAADGPDEDFRGYIASKKRYFFGVKIHLMVTAEGNPVEAFLTPGGRHDARALKQFEFDLPEGAMVIGDKAYNDYEFEDLLSKASDIDLRPLRRSNSKREESVSMEFIQHTYRKRIETEGSDLEKRLPSSIHAVDRRRLRAEGFSLRAGTELRWTDLTHNLG